MRVGLFTECYEPVINGVVHSIESTKKGLEALGHEVYVFCPDYKEKNKREKNVIHNPSQRLPSKSDYHFILGLSDKAKKVAGTLDIFHTHHPFTMGRHANEIAKAHNKPFLFTHHTQYDQYTRYVPILKKGAKKFLYNFLRKFCDKCDIVVAPSLSIKAVIEGYGTKTKVRVVPNGIRVKYFQEKNLSTPREILRLKPNHRIAIYTGRIAREKNIDFVIKAFKLVTLKYPQVYLLIVGGGTALKRLRRLAIKIGLAGKIIFTGKVPYLQMRNYYRACDFFVTASKTEVHPLVLLEAMAAGLPMVAVDAIGTSDIVSPGKTGYLTREDLDEYAAKILYLLRNPTRLNLMSKNARKASKAYSIINTAKKMVETYKEAQRLAR